MVGLLSSISPPSRIWRQIPPEPTAGHVDSRPDTLDFCRVAHAAHEENAKPRHVQAPEGSPEDQAHRQCSMTRWCSNRWTTRSKNGWEKSMETLKSLLDVPGICWSNWSTIDGSMRSPPANDRQRLKHVKTVGFLTVFPS